jgi:hypothetical protein
MSEHSYVYMGSIALGGISGTCCCGAALFDYGTAATYAVMLANHIQSVKSETESIWKEAEKTLDLGVE